MTSHRPRPPSQQNVNPFAALEDALPERLQEQLQPLHLAPSPATAATLQRYAKLNKNILQKLVQERDISHLLETACDDSSLEEALQSATVAQLIQVLQLAETMVRVGELLLLQPAHYLMFLPSYSTGKRAHERIPYRWRPLGWNRQVVDMFVERLCLNSNVVLPVVYATLVDV